MKNTWHVKRLSQRGLTLMELMVSIGLVSVMTMIISPFLYRQIEEFELEKISMTKISVQLQVERYLSDSNLKGFGEYTLGANANLKNCVLGQNTCSAVTEQGFAVYDSANQIISGASAATPARFDTNGAPCTTGPRCLFDVYTSYSTECYGGAGSCEIASSVTAIYTIRQNPETKMPLKGAPLMRTIVSAPIPIQKKSSSVPPFKVTSYTANGSLGVHQLCMIQSYGIGTCSVDGAFGTSWTMSGGSCQAAVCFDFL